LGQEMILALIGQDGGGGFDFIWLLIPLLCCTMTMGRGEKPQDSGSESESFYTPQDINKSFEKIENEVEQWRIAAQEQKKPEGLVSSLTNRLRGGTQEARFVEKEKNPPRLISLTDASGPIFFEFTEVEGGGTVVKATYGSSLKGRIAKLKAVLPLKIPVAPVGLNCPSCGKAVLRDFNLCPYCGSKLIKE
jgi:hypothetical protein